VSAPFYFHKADGGAVYVYTNDEDRCLDCAEPLKLTGQQESRFGFALANLGDLNKDGLVGFRQICTDMKRYIPKSCWPNSSVGRALAAKAGDPGLIPEFGHTF
jgi:hypothetical protein